MAVRHSTSRRRKTTAPERDGRMLTMQEAMDYLNSRGIPCKNRSTFYRIIKDFNIPYININLSGINEVRRFPPEGLRIFLEDRGILP